MKEKVKFSYLHVDKLEFDVFERMMPTVEGNDVDSYAVMFALEKQFGKDSIAY